MSSKSISSRFASISTHSVRVLGLRLICFSNEEISGLRVRVLLEFLSGRRSLCTGAAPALCCCHRRIHIVVCNHMPKFFCICDELRCNIRRHRLTALVVGYVSLGDAYPKGHCCLGHAKALPDGMNSVHVPILVGLIDVVNSRTNCL
jgi:hypothetical protein